MGGCAKSLNGINGIAHGVVKNNKAMGRLVIRAVSHFIQQGTQECIGSICNSGACSFGITKINEDIQIVDDVHGKGVTVTVTGDGECFCS